MTNNTDQRPVVRAMVDAHQLGYGTSIVILWGSPQWDFIGPTIERRHLDNNDDIPAHTAALKAAAEAWAVAMGYRVEWEDGE